jgi:hypothetical protein
MIDRLDDGRVFLNTTAERLAVLAEAGAGCEVWTADRVCLGTAVWRTQDELEVLGPDQVHRTRVPLTAIDRMSRNRLLLRADHAQTLLWTASTAP